MATLPTELAAVITALDTVETHARRLVGALTPAQGVWRAEPGSWSVSECLDHLATANRVYLAPMRDSADAARRAGRLRRRPARPGLLGGWFVRALEPPVKTLRARAQKAIRPRTAPSLAEASGALFASQDDVRAFIREFADLDLASITFKNPLVRGVRFSLATGLHVIPAHERRHLWQAENVRQHPRFPSALG